MPDDRNGEPPGDHAPGNRRIDRVLSERYLDGLSGLTLAEVRELRDDAEQEEADLSYLRRLLQGRVDIIKAELARRRGELGESGSIIDQLPQILADERSPARGSAATAPSSLPASMSTAGWSSASSATPTCLPSPAAPPTSWRRPSSGSANTSAQISEQRRAVQTVADACAHEITRRYREGEADVTALLPSET